MVLNPDWVGIGVSVIALLLIPFLVFVVRVAVKQTRVDDQLANVAIDIKELVENKDKIHSEILEQMRQDRSNADQRLRFMEEFWIKAGLRGGDATR